MNIVYRKLCEVRILHEYYLTEREGNTIFDLSSEDRAKFLAERMRENYPSINDDLEYKIPVGYVDVMLGRKLKLLPSYSGFQVLISAQEKEKTDGTTGLVPLIPLEDNFIVPVLLQYKSSKLDLISNTNISRRIPASYFFTNEKFRDTKTSPFLALPPAEKNALHSYEQGELARDSTDNSIKAFYVDNSGFDQWADVKGEGYVTENDRILISPDFIYSFVKKAGISSAVFTLTDSSGNELYSKEHSISKPSMQSRLDFTELIAEKQVPGAELKPVIYSLRVADNEGGVIIHDLVFNSALPYDCFGMIVLKIKTEDDDYSLLDNDGFLISDRFFEIRIKSRFTFWRYRNNRQKKIKANNSLDSYLEYNAEKGILDSIIFRNSTYLPTVFKSGAVSKFLPNPSSLETIKIENNRIYTEIIVPRSDLFDT